MNNDDMEARRLVAHNIAVHDRGAKQYEAIHGEIFNETEQNRLHAAISAACESVQTGSQTLKCLDFGCGSGNLSRHLLELGCAVTAADISRGFLDLVRSRYPTDRLKTLHMEDGKTFTVPDESFDLIATYSVLHHIPDYLGACRELGRMCKKGGVVFIDHEQNEERWKRNEIYTAFKSEALRVDWRKYLRPSNYVHRLRRLFNPRHSNEGDIHVWADDHIEWGEIAALMADLNFEVLVEEDYLLNRSLYRPEVYLRYANRCSDTKLMVFRKRLTAAN
jgi:2-polyprenyl-3-methyl-5-hydroxy-6-metoxy-1,4-benzoquinol methylase